ncbi:alpha/beta-hydrolase [Byssothecium circinans]|uniref:Alpha/beta-hydrolase n=1 Tax=Byssothecium circinans TaxID=147558 RepID=A0A6A5TYX4_9PLEO|nr:alpha/beta-hydrolase [Byssothecium circinans]
MKSTFALLALSGLSAAAPLEARKEAVTPAVFDKLVFYAQYAAASYCKGNNNTPNTKVKCPGKLCEKVEAANTNTLTEFQNTAETDATGFVATDTTNSLIVISFRGSKSDKNWDSNLDVGLDSFSACSGCKAHGGFKASWEESQAAVVKAVKDAQAKYPKYKVIATGHSLGGAMATIAAAALRASGTTVDLYTYGAPKAGNDKLASFLQKTDKGLSYRVVHKNDPVPALPPSVPFLLPFEHIQPEYYITTAGNATVKAADVVMYQKGEDDGSSSDEADAHRAYFGRISACESDD